MAATALVGLTIALVVSVVLSLAERDPAWPLQVALCGVVGVTSALAIAWLLTRRTGQWVTWGSQLDAARSKAVAAADARLGPPDADVAVLVASVVATEADGSGVASQRRALAADAVERALRTSLLGDQTLHRLSPTEFVVLVPGGDAVSARVVAQRLQKATVEPVVIGGRPVSVRLAVGAIGASSLPLAALVEHAEQAVQLALASGRRYHEWSEDVHRQVVRTARIRRALEARFEPAQLELVFQPIVRLADRRVLGAEALVRWQHPELGPIGPAEFVPIAEREQRMLELDLWIYEAAVREGSRALGALGDPAAQVAINLSAPAIEHPLLIGRLAAIHERLGLPARGFLIELTETASITNLDQAEANVRRAQQLGLRVAIDDFVAGHTTMVHLERLPVDEVKLDRSLVRAAASSARGGQLLAGTTRLLHSLGAVVVAEGVEDAAQLDALRTAGVDLAQGFALGRPVPVAALVDRIGVEQRPCWDPPLGMPGAHSVLRPRLPAS